MPGKQRCYQLGLCGLALFVSLQAGCLSFVHPIDPLPAEEVASEIDLPAACKNGVYIFFLHGVDPLDLGNLSGLCDYVRTLGFIKTYYGMPFHAFYYEAEICKIRKKNPHARIVLIGFSYGAGLMHDIAYSLAEKAIDVDLIVNIDPVEFEKRSSTCPANVFKVINILSFNRSENGNYLEGENVRYNDVWHFGTVTDPRTLRMLTHELGVVAQRVPVITTLPEPIPGVIVPKPEILPGPLPDAVVPKREVLPQPTPISKRGEWDFLKPDSHTGRVPNMKPSADAFRIKPAALTDQHP